MVMRRAAARSGEWAQHFSNASCSKIKLAVYFPCFDADTAYMNVVSIWFLGIFYFIQPNAIMTLFLSVMPRVHKMML